MNDTHKDYVKVAKVADRSLFLTLNFILLISLQWIQPVAAQSLSGSFSDDFIVGGMTKAISIDWLPDGRALMAGQEGHVYLIDIARRTQSLYLTVPSVNSTGEYGLLDIAVDNEFASTGYFYVYYSESPSSQLHIDRYRFTGNGSADAASRTVIWTNPGVNANSLGRNHIGGSLNIGPDNKFYLSVGDALSSSAAQQMTNVFGKILRINKNGTVPSDNPFYDASNPNNVDEIWAFGVRNPFRGSWDLQTGRYYFGDVGGNQAEQAYEEVNIGQRGANYGWPMCEGPLSQPKNGPTCPSGVRGPIYTYPHNPSGGCCENAAVTGGSIVRGARIPAQMQNAYVYADFAEQSSRFLTFDGNGNVNGNVHLKDLVFPVWIGQGPDGYIYYVRYNYTRFGELRRLRFTGNNNQPPSITSVSTSQTVGSTPLVVDFRATASDPEGDPISYRWNFGDGATSTGQNPTHTYTRQGSFSATLSVTSAGQTTSASPIQITAGSAPSVAISSPANGSFFVAGQTINLRGSAVDDGPLNNSSYSWNILFAHGNHRHPALSNAVGQTLSYRIDDTGHDFSGDTSYIIQLTVTDELGLSSTESIEIEPRKIGFRIQADSGISTVIIDGITRSVPFTLDTVAGFKHSVRAVAQGCNNQFAMVFDRWNDGGLLSHLFTVPSSGGSLTAHYSQPDTPLGSAISCTDNAIAQVTLPAHGSVISTDISRVDVAMKVTGVRELDHLGYSVRDEDSGLYWNGDSARYQAQEYLNYISTIPRGQYIHEAQGHFTGAPAQGGRYQIRGWARDINGIESFGPRIGFRVTTQDTDGDGMSDLFENTHGLDPNDPNDASQDADGDGLSNKQEAEIAGLNPRNADTDGDSLDDGFEVENDLNPLEANECPNWLCHRSPGWLWSKGRE